MTQENADIEIDFHVTPDAWLDTEQLLAMFHENNPQTRSGLETEAIQYSIQTDGFASEMIIVNRWNGKIVSGHGKVWSCHQAGYRGQLPVIYKDYPSEEQHRLAMMRWNRARGHQDLELEKLEVQNLLTQYDRELVQTSLAYPDDKLAILLNEFPPVEGREATRNHKDGEESPSHWVDLKVQVSPDTHALYNSLLEKIPGTNDGEKFSLILQCVDVANFPYLFNKDQEADEEFDLFDEGEAVNGIENDRN